MRSLKGSSSRTVAAVAALVTAIAIAAFPATASASASSDASAYATVSAVTADSAGVLSTSCKIGTGWTNGDNTNSRNYAWASCYDTNALSRPWNEFRVEWSCTGEGYMRNGTWTAMDGKVQSGTCALGKRVDVHRVGTRWVGP